MLYRILAAAVGVCLLAACGTAPTSVAVESSPPTPVVLSSPEDGGVVMRVLVNHEATNHYLAGWRPVTLVREDGPAQEIVLRANADAASHSAVFASALPPGRYRFARMPGYACAYVCLPSSVTPNANFVRFDVARGQLTDLGAIVLGTGGTSGTSAVVVSIEAKPSGVAIDELVRELVPGLLPLLAKPVRHWADAVQAAPTPAKAAASDPSAPRPPLPKEMPDSVRLDLATALGDLARLSSKGFTAPSETTEPGRFIHGSSVGVVYSRPGAGRRQAHNVGVRAAIDAVLAVPDGRWIAGGEYGLIKQSRDSGKTWESVRGDLPFGLVVGLAHARGQVFAAVLRGGELRLMATELAMLGPGSRWRPVFTGMLDASSFWNATQRPQLFVQGDRLAVTLPNRQLVMIDLASSAARTHALPGHVQFFEFSADGVLRCRCASGVVNPFESRDGGQTWTEIDVSRYWMLPVFRDARQGVMLQNAFAGASKLAWTADGGKTWNESRAEVSHDLNHIRWSADGKSVYAASAQGQFWVSRDEGRSWQKQL